MSKLHPKMSAQELGFFPKTYESMLFFIASDASITMLYLLFLIAVKALSYHKDLIESAMLAYEVLAVFKQLEFLLVKTGDF